MAQYPKIESRGSIGSIILAILEVQVGVPLDQGLDSLLTTWIAKVPITMVLDPKIEGVRAIAFLTSGVEATK